MEQAKESATERMTVGKSSLVYRYTIPQHTCDRYRYRYRYRYRKKKNENWCTSVCS